MRHCLNNHLYIIVFKDQNIDYYFIEFDDDGAWNVLIELIAIFMEYFYLASEPEFKNGQFTGRLDGEPCYQEGKVTKVKEWLSVNKYSNYNDIFFYTDSHNDLQLMEFCSKPIAVDPDDKLKEISIQKNWEIISLR